MDFIHKWLPGNESENVTLVLLHGTGGSEEDLIGLGQLVWPGASLLGIRGQVKEGPMNRFFKRLSEGVFDEADLIFRTKELGDFVDVARKKYGFSGQKVIALGYSNGANIAASALLIEPSVFDGAILFRSMVPLVPEHLPELNGMPVFMSMGLEDPLIPTENSRQLVNMLEASGAVVTQSWQMTGHGLVQEDLVQAQAWVKEVRETRGESS